MFPVYGGDKELVVNGYVDASFDTDLDDSKSQTGYVFLFNGGVVCSDPTSNDQASVYLCHPWIGMLAHTVHQCIYQSAITCINNVKLIYTS